VKNKGQIASVDKYHVPGTPIELLLNWFRAREQVALGAVEGLNNKAKVTCRKAYGFRNFEVLKVALYHTLGCLPEPEGPHRFC